MHVPTLARRMVLVAMLPLALACDRTPTGLDRNDPSLTLQLNLNHQDGVLDSALSYAGAFVLDYRLPFAINYRAVEQLYMTRRGDDAMLDWYPAGDSRRNLLLSSTLQIEPNWRLHFTGHNGRLGLRDLRPGDTLDLAVTTRGRLVTATVVLPGLARLTRVPRADAMELQWRRVPGARYYEVTAPSTDAPFHMTSDSSYTLSASTLAASPAGAFLEVRVWDAAHAGRVFQTFGGVPMVNGIRTQVAASMADRVTLAP